MSNFKFLEQDWSSIYRKMKKAEERVNTEPVSTATYCRLALEESIHTIFDLERIEKPFNTELVQLMNHEEIKNIIPNYIAEGLHIVRKAGNNAVHHGNRINSSDALISIKYCFTYFKWFSQNYSSEEPELPSYFNDAFVPKIGENQRILKELKAEAEKAQQALLDQIQKLQEQNEAILQFFRAYLGHH